MRSGRLVGFPTPQPQILNPLFLHTRRRTLRVFYFVVELDFVSPRPALSNQVGRLPPFSAPTERVRFLVPAMFNHWQLWFQDCAIPAFRRSFECGEKSRSWAEKVRPILLSFGIVGGGECPKKLEKSDAVNKQCSPKPRLL
jgi:hypothetical protein